MSVVVVPLHAYFRPSHLEHVKSRMRELGPPRIRGFFDEQSNAWFTKEGTHRLRAALALGVTPVMVPTPWKRTKKALEAARFAAVERGHVFPRVDVAS